MWFGGVCVVSSILVESFEFIDEAVPNFLSLPITYLHA
jgi:hypothetical protein